MGPLVPAIINEGDCRTLANRLNDTRMPKTMYGVYWSVRQRLPIVCQADSGRGRKLDADPLHELIGVYGRGAVAEDIWADIQEMREQAISAMLKQAEG